MTDPENTDDFVKQLSGVPLFRGVAPADLSGVPLFRGVAPADLSHTRSAGW